METPHNASPVRVIEEVDGIDRLEPLGAYQSQLVDLVRAASRPGSTPSTSPAPLPTPTTVRV